MTSSQHSSSMTILAACFIVMVCATSAQQYYSCNGVLYTFPHSACRYDNNNNNNNGNLPVYYSCNGLLYTFPFAGCTYGAVASQARGGLDLLP
ncbi:hypothetical protein BV898_10691 [Hypsibius exemplaris]|uniref:Chitin-binding type-2 domain-containing protein n=1 Tax=Hypsibius exemplaris TaxID=2072580 RepID=A0A1W0WJ05_HYPEX|nr:hypothetical protein BV898_10691 [Hypsibius exemplaris]